MTAQETDSAGKPGGESMNNLSLSSGGYYCPGLFHPKSVLTHERHFIHLHPARSSCRCIATKAGVHLRGFGAAGPCLCCLQDWTRRSGLRVLS